jgi:hypothetical protein
MNAVVSMRVEGARLRIDLRMKEQGPVTWIEQRVAELEGNVAASKAEMHSLFIAGTGLNPQLSAGVESWKKELEGLKSLSYIGGD